MFIFWVLFFSSIIANSNGEYCASTKRFIAYLNGTKEFSPEMEIPSANEAKYLTHLVYAHAFVDLNRNLSFKNPKQFRRIQLAARKYPNLKLIVSIAWEQDLDFMYTMPNYPESRVIFRRNVLDFIVANNLDGIDIDWEHSLSISAKYMTQEDKGNIFTLLAEMRADLDSLQRERNASSAFLLSMIAAKRPGGFFFMDQFELEKAMELVDFISVKSYGYNTHWQVYTAPSSPLHFDPNSPIKKGKRENIDWTMGHYGCRTGRLEKLNLMIALDGYFWQSESFADGNGENEGIYRKVRVPFSSGILEWGELREKFGGQIGNGSLYNLNAEIAYLVVEERKTFLIFENEKSIGAKIEYARKYGLGGIAIYPMDFGIQRNSLVDFIGEKTFPQNCSEIKLEKFDCKIEQDEECVRAEGECMLAQKCTQNGKSTIHQKCPSAGVSDVICCIGNGQNGESKLFWIILAFVGAIGGGMAIFGIAKFIRKRNLRFIRPKLDSINSKSTIVTSISGDEQVAIQWPVNLTRSERPTMETVSTLNDLIFLNEFGRKWSEIEKNSAKLTINEKIYSNFLPSEEFTKICELGRGNYSQVNKYKFRGMEIAIKQIRLSSGDEELKRAFIDLSVLSSCKSAFITQYYGYYIDQDYIHICMEPMATCFWKILEFDLQRRRGIPEAAMGKVALGLIKALEYLRAKHGIMHRDVKPSNILLGQNGVKLCDFGIAGRMNESKAFTACIGCLAYLAPERINTDNIYDIKADVWSVGVTALELVTGRHPFQAPDEIEMLMKISHEPPTIPAQKEPFSLEFANFYKSCLHKKFQKRPNYKQLLNSTFLRHQERMQTDVWGWYRRIRGKKKLRTN